MTDSNRRVKYFGASLRRPNAFCAIVPNICCAEWSLALESSISTMQRDRDGASSIAARVWLFLFLILILSGGAARHTTAAATVPLPAGPDWMGSLSAQLGPLPLNRIVMPGTHDSASFSIPAAGRLAPAPMGAISPDVQDPTDPLSALVALLPRALQQQVSAPWSRAQDLDIAAQLAAGVRYLDVRVCAGPAAYPGLYACHGLYGAPIRTAVLEPAARFLAAHSKEILILDFHRFTAPNSPSGMPAALHQELAAEIRAAFPGLLLPPGPLGARITLNDVWQTPGRVIVLYNDGPTVRANHDFWPYADTIIAWPSTDRLPVLEQRVVANLLCRCDILHGIPAATGAFFDLQLQMTPSRAAYLSGTFGAGHIRSLRDLAASNVTMLAYLKEKLGSTFSSGRTHLNVLTADFIEAPALLPLAEALDMDGAPQ